MIHQKFRISWSHISFSLVKSQTVEDAIKIKLYGSWLAFPLQYYTQTKFYIQILAVSTVLIQSNMTQIVLLKRHFKYMLLNSKFISIFHIQPKLSWFFGFCNQPTHEHTNKSIIYFDNGQVIDSSINSVRKNQERHLLHTRIRLAQ